MMLMYGKTFCVLIIVLVLIYNLATGSVETVASSNTESLTSWATYGTLVQAGAAVITLGIMVWLGIRQNAMTRRQINLSLYEKRYEIYTSIEKIVKDFLELEKPSRKNPDELLLECGEYRETGSLYKEYVDEIKKLPARYLLDDEGINIISEIQAHMVSFMNEVDQDKIINDEAICKAEIRLEADLKELQDYFLRYLDFRNI